MAYPATAIHLRPPQLIRQPARKNLQDTSRGFRNALNHPNDACLDSQHIGQKQRQDIDHHSLDISMKKLVRLTAQTFRGSDLIFDPNCF